MLLISPCKHIFTIAGHRSPVCQYLLINSDVDGSNPCDGRAFISFGRDKKCKTNNGKMSDV